jgi:ATP-dependent Clp protease ATP-binding subunit ClpC
MRFNWILRLYPSAWRRRYQEEMQALLEMHTITIATVLDLLFGAIDAWLDPTYRTKGKNTTQMFLDTLTKSISLFDKFSTRAQKIVSLAGEEAQQLQHTMVGTEHLLLGLLREGESSAAHVLEELGVTLEDVREAVETAQKQSNAIMQGEIMLSPHAKMALKMAIAEADLSHPQTDFPLLGTQYMLTSKAAQIVQNAKVPPTLEELGVTVEKVREAIEKAQERGDSIVPIQIETGMAPFANKPENADDWHHPFIRIDTENLLLGLLRVPESTAVRILQGLDVPSPNDIRKLLYLEHSTTWQTYNQGYAQRFTRQARRAWSLSQEEARRCQDGYIGSHHLLLGLVGEGSGIAASVLVQMGVELSEMRKEIERMYGRGDSIVADDIKLTQHLKDIIELASNEARRLNHRSIGTGHLLLVLMREEDGLEAGILESLGVDLDRMRLEIRRTFSEQTNVPEQEVEVVIDEMDEKELYAPYASIALIERDLQRRELGKTLLAVYPFTLEARDVLAIAHIEATRLDQSVGPEHLLVGLAYLTFRDNGPVSEVLKDAGINFAKAQAAVENRSGQGAPSVVLLQNPLCTACLLLAADEAERREGRGTQIKSEHLLLGLLREEQGIIADLLSDLGTSVEIVRIKVLSHLGDRDSAGMRQAEN